MKEIIVENDGIKWVTHEGMRHLASEGWEPNIQECISDYVIDKSLFLDLGANTGAFAINLSKYFVEVYAIEPHPLNVHLMKKTIELNGIKNVRIFQLAAWDKPFILKLHQTFENDLASGTMSTEVVVPGCLRTTDVVGLPLDYLNIKPSVIKIDIEGSEIEAINGLSETLHAYKPVLFVEIHTVFGVSVPETVDVIKRFGYNKMLNITIGNQSASTNAFFVGGTMLEEKMEKDGWVVIDI